MNLHQKTIKYQISNNSNNVLDKIEKPSPHHKVKLSRTNPYTECCDPKCTWINPQINENNIAPSIPTSKRVLNAVNVLLYSREFSTLNLNERAKQVNTLLEALPQEVQNSLHGKIYELSKDPFKGGDQWGKYHVADDPTVLKDALEQCLG